jgi:hypothetical protein
MKVILNRPSSRENVELLNQPFRLFKTLTTVLRGNWITIDGNLLNHAGPRMIAGTAASCEKLKQVRQHRKIIP